MFLEKNTVSSRKERRRRFRVSGSMGAVSAPSADSPFFHAACSPMDYSPIATDLASVFVEADDTSNSSTAASRRNVYIHTEEDDDELQSDSDESDNGLIRAPVELPSFELPSLSPSRSSSSSSMVFPVAKRRASASAVYDSRG